MTRSPFKFIICLFLFSFLDETMTVGEEKFFQVSDLLAQLDTYVGIGYQHPAVRHLHDLCGALDVGTLLDGILGAREWLVLNELKPRE